MKNLCFKTAPFPLIFALLLLVASLPVHAEDSEARLSRALLSLMDADQRVTDKETQAAIPLYEESLALLTRLQQDDPDFKSRIVNFRIEDIRQKLANLRPATATPSQIPAPAPQDGPNFEERYLQTKEQALRDAQRLLDVERRMMELQLILRERDQMLAEQGNELEELGRRSETFQRETGRELEDARIEIQSLRRFNALLQERVTGLETQNEKLTLDIGESREAEALRQMQIREMEAAIAERRQQQEQAARQAAEEVDALQNRLLERGQESRGRQEKLEEQQVLIEGFQERLANMERLEDTVIELNRRLNLRNEEFVALQAEVDKIAVAETARDEALAAFAAAKEAQSRAEGLAEEKSRGFENMKAEQEALISKLAEALNENRETRLGLERAQQRIQELEAPPATEPEVPDVVDPEPDAAE